MRTRKNNLSIFIYSIFLIASALIMLLNVEMIFAKEEISNEVNISVKEIISDNDTTVVLDGDVDKINIIDDNGNKKVVNVINMDKTPPNLKISIVKKKGV